LRNASDFSGESRWMSAVWMKRKAVIAMSSGVFLAVHAIEALSHSTDNYCDYRIFGMPHGQFAQSP